MAEASSAGRQGPRVAAYPSHGLCPVEPGLQTAAAVSMGSADHQFSLAEILSQNYGVREGHEAAAGGPEKPEEELEKDFISQSSDMPLDELLALYGYEASDPVLEQESNSADAAPPLLDVTLDEEQIAKDLLSGEEETQPSADDLTLSVTSHAASALFPNQSGPRFLARGDKEPGSSASSDTEEDALPANKCKKEIMVGPQFQADLSSLHVSRPSEKIYENEDQLLWDPHVLPEREVEEFLYRAVKRRWDEAAGPQLPDGEAVKDSEQALYELVRCSFNAEEALRRLCFNVKVIRVPAPHAIFSLDFHTWAPTLSPTLIIPLAFPPADHPAADGLCAWSEEECRNFEHGFRVHGKNFHLIQANKVRTRSVGECVEYYYLWKKSERFDYFTQQTRLGRRKDTDQDLDGGDPDGPGRPRPSLPLPSTTNGLGSEQDALGGLCTAAFSPAEPLSVDATTRCLSSLDEPGGGGLQITEPRPCPFQTLDEPPAGPLPQRPPTLGDQAFYPPAPGVLEPGARPRLAVDLALPGALPEELPIISSHVGLDKDHTEPVAPAQVALSVAEFGLIGIGDVNPFLAARPACPAPGLHSEPLSHCNVMTC
ncbi:mesoderm induction early response protein 2 isoform 3-T3 [Dugong dugon]